MTRRLSLYQDVKEVLDQAILAGGGEYELETHGKAVHWRQRAYIFRKLYAAQFPQSPYDRLTFKRVEPESTSVRIVVADARGIFRPKNLVKQAAATADDPLMQEALDLAKDLDL